MLRVSYGIMKSCTQSCGRPFASTDARDAGVLFLTGAESPGHARRVVPDSDAAHGVEQNNAPVAVEALLQIIHRLLRYPFRQAPGFDAIRRPFRQHQFHDRFAPSSSRRCGAAIIGVAAAADERGVAKATGSLIECAPSGSRSCDIAIAVEGDGSNRVVRKHVL